MEEYRLIQDGIAVACVQGERAFQEIMHYAMVYGMDGPVTVEQRQGRKWVAVSASPLPTH